MTPIANKTLKDEYAAYCAEERARHYSPVSYEMWLEGTVNALRLDLANAQARIDAAAAIEQRAYDYSVGNRGGDEEIMYGEANGWNECWYTFRRALGKDSECHE